MRFGLSFKKNKNVQPEDPSELGDIWTYTSIKRESGLMISICSGKRIQETCETMLIQFFERMELPLPDNKISISTDGNCQYTSILKDLFAESCIDYGQIIKIKENNQLIAIIREKIIGNPADKLISTSIVESYNNKIRQRLSRFVRKTASFSKKKLGHVASLNVFQFVHNFIDMKTDIQTPAMMESITDHRWSWDEFLSHHIQL